MIRTQIYISENEKKALKEFCLFTGKSQSEIIREAISSYLKEQKLLNNDSAFGIWKDNNFDYKAFRKEFDRNNE